MLADDLILVSVDDHLAEPPDVDAHHLKAEDGVEPTAFDEMRPGCYDLHERVNDMDAGGVLGSRCFPSFPGFSGRLFAAVEDQELARELAAITCADVCRWHHFDPFTEAATA